MAMLFPAQQVEFGFIRDQLEVTDSDLSKQLRTLSELGYLTVERVGDRRGGTTWVSVTEIGRERYEAHCAALREIVDGA